MRRRDSWRIKAEILRTCKEEPQTVTEILLKVKMIGSYYIKFIKELAEKGMLQVEGKRYRTTQKGLEWLKLYNQLKKMEGEQT